jgi:hypothetical protein
MSLVQGLFNPPLMQLSRAREWNREFGWGFSERDFEEAENNVPAWPQRSLTPVVLVPYLSPKGEEDGVQRTFRELWTRAHAYVSNHPDNRFSRGMYPKHQRFGAHVPGLRWEVIDLGARRGLSYEAALSARSAPGAGVLAAAIMHERWAVSMDGEKIPFVWMLGYTFDRVFKDCVDAIGLYRDGESKTICPSFWGGQALVEWAIPTFYED